MKATVNDYSKLKVEGCSFHLKCEGVQYPHPGWYFKGEFIGFNAHEAIDWLQRHGI